MFLGNCGFCQQSPTQYFEKDVFRTPFECKKFCKTEKPSAFIFGVFISITKKLGMIQEFSTEKKRSIVTFISPEADRKLILS